MGPKFKLQNSRSVIPNLNDEIYQMAATRASAEGSKTEPCFYAKYTEKKQSGAGRGSGAPPEGSFHPSYSKLQNILAHLPGRREALYELLIETSWPTPPRSFFF